MRLNRLSMLQPPPPPPCVYERCGGAAIMMTSIGRQKFGSPRYNNNNKILFQTILYTYIHVQCVHIVK